MVIPVLWKSYVMDKQTSKTDLKQLLFLALVAILIVVLIVTIVILLKNKDLIQKNPFEYGLDLYNYSSCSCVDYNGKFINFQK